MLLIWNSIVWVSLACSRLETLFGSQSVLKRRLLPGKVLARGTRGLPEGHGGISGKGLLDGLSRFCVLWNADSIPDKPHALAYVRNDGKPAKTPVFPRLWKCGMIGLKLVMEAGKCTFNCLSIPREIAQHDRSN